jgi:hypothetical protein
MMKKSFVGSNWWAICGCAAGLLVAGCGASGPEAGENLGEEASRLTAPTQVQTFAFLSTGHVSVLDRSRVIGGNIGVSAGSGDSITGGFDSQLGVSKALIGQRIVLNDRAIAGDLFVTQLVAPHATFASQNPFSAPPVPPPIVAFTAGTAPLTVNSGTTTSRPAGNFGQVTINGTLNLTGGLYQFQQLTMGPDGAMIANAPSIVRVAGKVTGGDRVHILASGTQGAGALRLVVAGATNTSGGVTLGTDVQMTALVMSRAAFKAGDRFIASGAIGATDINVGLDSRFTFNTGFACDTNAGCNDNNDCTVDSCVDGQCTHSSAANGTACGDDGTTCTTDICSNGTCTHPPVTNGTTCADDGNTCTTDVCTNGLCVHPFVPDGVACPDDNNECTNDLCFQGNCAHTAVSDGTLCTDDGNVCTSDACFNGVCDHPPNDGVACADDGNECTSDTCLGGACAHPAVPDGSTCTADADTCTSDVCQAGQCAHPPAPLDTPVNCGNCGLSCASSLGADASYVCLANPATMRGTCEFGACSDQHTPIVRTAAGGNAGRSVTLSGFSLAQSDVFEVAVLTDQTNKDPMDCSLTDSEANPPPANPDWLFLGDIAADATPSFTGVDPGTGIVQRFYHWQLTVTVPSSVDWPDGGLARFRIIGIGAAFENEDCVKQNKDENFDTTILDRCAGASMHQNCLVQGPVGPPTFQVVTLADGDPLPIPKASPFCPNQVGSYIAFREPDLDPGCDYDGETQQYYGLIDGGADAQHQLRDTLDKWKSANGYPGNTGDVNAKYYNAGDLGIGRDMHCWSPTPAGGTACYVTNYGASFVNNTPQDVALDAVISGTGAVATVAMEYVPTPGLPDPVRFFVFDGPTGQRLNKVQLDSEFAKPVPGNCLHCHGGRYDTTTHRVGGNGLAAANFLQFDTCSFTFSTDTAWTLEAQEDTFRRLNQIVLDSDPNAGIVDLIKGFYGIPQSQTPPITLPAGGTIDPEFVPAAWITGDPAKDPALKDLYLDVVKPYCRTCHVSLDQNAGSPSPSIVNAAAQNEACGTRAAFNPMPHAEATLKRFWTGSGRAVLINALNDGTIGTTPLTPGSCSP